MSECCICLDDIKQKDKYKLTCEHEFHENCIIKWFVNSDTCPLCRKSIVIEDPKKVLDMRQSNRNTNTNRTTLIEPLRYCAHCNGQFGRLDTIYCRTTSNGTLRYHTNCWNERPVREHNESSSDDFDSSSDDEVFRPVINQTNPLIKCWYCNTRIIPNDFMQINVNGRTKSVHEQCFIERSSWENYPYYPPTSEYL